MRTITLTDEMYAVLVDAIEDARDYREGETYGQDLEPTDRDYLIRYAALRDALKEQQ